MLIVISGPPCSGKSTYWQQRAKPNDIVIDLDEIANSLRPNDQHHEYPDYLRTTAMAARASAIKHALQRRLYARADVYVIDSNPSAASRRTYRAHKAKVVTLDPGIEVCLTRARGTRPAAAKQYIEQWYAERGTPYK